MRTGGDLTTTSAKTTPTLNNYLNPAQSPAPTICIPVDQILLPSHAFLRHADRSRSSVCVCVLPFLATHPTSAFC